MRRTEIGVVRRVRPGAVEKRSAPAAGRDVARRGRPEPKHAEVRQRRAGQRGGVAPAPSRVRGSHQLCAPVDLALPLVRLIERGSKGFPRTPFRPVV